MKTHELADLLDQCAKLLKSLPNGGISQKIDQLQKLVDTSNISEHGKGRSTFVALPKNIVETLHRIPHDQIESFIENDVNFVSTASVLRLAEKLGVQASKRQNRPALINMIVRHLEASRMDALIRREGIESEVTPDT